MNAIIFPGQGSQKVGMGREVSEKFAPAAEIFERANAVLGYDLRALCFDGPEESLKDTTVAQPALLTVGYIHFEAAKAEGLEAALAAGHSLGEYTALVAAGALEFEEALRLVQQRAELMSKSRNGAMAALIGLPDEKLEEVLSVAGELGVVVAANFNSPGQVVVSGDVAAVEAAMSEGKARGAKIAVKLPVSGAFHSPLLAEAGEQMAKLIDAAPLVDAKIPVYQNTTASPATKAEDLRSALRPQMTSAVRWTGTVQTMIADGATTFIELGPGSVLTGLVKRIDKSVTLQNL
ncbi:[acyl-carrier-protein] S-malonyltransferase [bacterium]|nr:MAG: [acyl-carrier-protein] S-malonyltransferase [bacterium]